MGCNLGGGGDNEVCSVNVHQLSNLGWLGLKGYQWRSQDFRPKEPKKIRGWVGGGGQIRRKLNDESKQRTHRGSPLFFSFPLLLFRGTLRQWP